MARTEKQKLHDKAIRSLTSRLRIGGIKSRVMPDSWSHFDLLLSTGASCEVKAAEAHGTPPEWKFNLHRHGAIDTRPVDYYALYCAIPKGYGIWLIMPASELKDTYTQAITWRSLSTTWGKWIKRYDLLGCKDDTNPS